MHQICDACETVAHCSKHGCIPPIITDTGSAKAAAPCDCLVTVCAALAWLLVILSGALAIALLADFFIFSR